MSIAFSRRIVHRISLFLIAVVGLLSCQTETSTRPDPGGAFQVQQDWSVEPERYPDSVAWIHNGTHGAFSVERLSAIAFQVTATFPRSIAFDSMAVELWRLGMRTTIVQVKVTENGKMEANKEIRDVDEHAVALLKGFDSARSVSGAYGNSSDPVPVQIAALQRYLASRILAGTFSVKLLPHGVDSLAVMAKVLVQGSLEGKSVIRIAAVAQVDFAQLRIRAEGMLRSGELPSSDSLVLFPPDPIRVVKALAIEGSLEAGGATVSVRGSFTWNKGLKVGNPQYQVRGPLGRSEDFLFQVQQLPGNTDTSWSLDGNFSIQAKASAVAGTDTLFVTLQDDSGRSVTASVPFAVLARDTTTPAVQLVRPSKDTSVPNGTRSIELVATATDPAGISSIQVGSQSCPSSPCNVSVPLAVGENVVVVDAWDKAGNHLPSPLRLTVTRANDPGDTVPPRIERILPTDRKIVADYSIKTLSMSYKVTDDSLDLVSLNGRILVAASGVFQATVDLRVGADTLVLQAMDKRGNPARDTVFVTRNQDTTKPTLKLVSPATDTQVAFATASLRVLVSATDPAGIDTVWVGGVRSESSTSPYAAIVPLALGRNTLVIEAVDSYGNRSGKELVIVRASAFDSIAPRIEKIAPRTDTSVAPTATSLKLSWKVTDDSTLSQVSLNGTKLIVGTDGLYSTTQSLTVGPNVFVLEAKDARGNTRLDTLRVSRLADATGPKIVYKGGSKDSAVWAYVPSVVVSWGVTDDALKSVSINGALVSGQSGVFSTTVSLATDTTMVRLIASDETGNIATDSVRVVRKYDKTAPTVAFQKTKVRLVANAVTADTLVWKVSDNLKLKSVTVNGAVVPASNGSFTHIVASLPVGTRSYILIAIDSAGNVTKDTATVARTALAPTHSAAAGNYIGTVYDTLKSEGADSILYSLDGENWSKATGPVLVSDVGAKVVYAKAYPGERLASVSYQVSKIKTVALGGSHFLSNAISVFVKLDGTVWVSGQNPINGTIGVAAPPGETVVAAAQKISAKASDVTIAKNAGGSSSIFLYQENSTILAAGANSVGQLGIGTVDDNSVSYAEVKLDNIRQVVVDGTNSYFLVSDGSIYWSGLDQSVQEIDWSNPKVESTPVKFAAPQKLPPADVMEMRSFSTALDRNGQLWTWGGDAPFKEFSGVRSYDHFNNIFAVMNDGTVLARGESNSYGQMGVSTTASVPVFTPVVGLTNIVSVAAGGAHTLYLDKNGVLFYSGIIPTDMIGIGQYTGPVSLVPSELARDVVAIWAGQDASFFQKKDGTIWALGYNWAGIFGDGSRESTGAPRRINF